MRPPDPTMLQNDRDDDGVGTAPIEPAAVTITQAAAMIGMSRATFCRMESAGQIGPLPRYFSKRCKRYSVSDIRQWVEAGMPPRHVWQATKHQPHGRTIAIDAR